MFRRLLFTSLLTCSFFIAFSQPAPNFTVTDAHGNTHRLYQDYLDQGKTVVLKLFFVNCPPCNAIAPFFRGLYEDWGSGQGDVEFIELSILSSDTDAAVINYENQHGITFPGVSPQGGSLLANQPYRDGTYGFYIGTPTFVVIAPDRSVQYDVRGSGINATIDSLDVAIAATGAVKNPSMVDIGGRIETITGRPVPGAKVFVVGFENNFDITDNAGNYSITMEVEAGVDYHVVAEKQDSFNAGVSVLDLVQIRKHILRLDTFTSPFKHYAADANNSNSISVLDVVQFSKLILRLTHVIPNRTTPWQFIDAMTDLARFYNFPSGNYGVMFNTNSNLSALNMTGVKFGDLNDTVPLN